MKIRRADSHTMSLLARSFKGRRGKRLGCMPFACSLSLLLWRGVSVLTKPDAVMVGLCGLGLCDQFERRALRSSHTSAQHDSGQSSAVEQPVNWETH